MKILRKLLFPFALLYGLIMWIRNFFYNSGILKSRAYTLPVICVGNLNAGGTGKSPMIEYLLKFLLPKFRVASLSRGYKRSTKGYHLLSGEETAGEVGDEPLQFKRKFNRAIVAVEADRQNGIFQLKNQNPEVILLDDAFQHRKVEAGLNILLTAYGDLYVDDFMLPTGNLREPTAGAERAKIIIVTKCPPKLIKPEMERIRHKLELRNYQKLFFSFIDYSDSVISKEKTLKLEQLKAKQVTLVTGIANPKPLTLFLEKKAIGFKHLKYKDHHNFSASEIAHLQEKEFVLTTEKDYVRLVDHFEREQLYYLPVQSAFLANEKEFQQEILDFMHKK
ncbi:lipid-A-disaccharide kinase [Salegentibacter echinorum]|uniref:Tetraacyldisaccharide 4'-kinase n=1 Tax=Salegentibacter echinorum TaxID=1073325 RepID=A0A1M5BXA3_SALEC|nr:tetraacyldisaccharide 4'-kinase [Salegentibacter echinorum]SHF47148.1 lipid-A-disaccharide kinase [Salegentibacter echinorum]